MGIIGNIFKELFGNPLKDVVKTEYKPTGLSPTKNLIPGGEISNVQHFTFPISPTSYLGNYPISGIIAQTGSLNTKGLYNTGWYWVSGVKI